MTRKLLLAALMPIVCVGTDAAWAMPLDVGGAVPPSKTPPAASPDPLCTQSYANDARRGGPRLRFGIGPLPAGGGPGETDPVVREDPAKRDAALEELRGRSSFTLRLNRLFMADGSRGIARFKRLASHFARLGFDVELQVRYHPGPGHDGDIAAWLRYVDRVVRAFGPNRRVTGLQITNEVNLTFSPNTSDGAYRNAVEALVRGVMEAKRMSRKLGYRQQRIGFNYAWRFGDQNDAQFWSRIGKLGGAAFRRSVDWVGVDLYPGTFFPLAAQTVNIGDAFLEGVAQVRECYMRKARLGRSVPLRIEETGYATGPDRSDAKQVEAVKAIVTAANAYRGTYGISDFRWFDLRDNNTAGGNLSSHWGLLHDDYSVKPGFREYRRLVARYGARGAQSRPPRRPSTTLQ